MKARRVVDLIRGLPASDAQALLRFAPQAASEPIGKVLDSAIANAANNYAADTRSLVVSEAFVDEGPTFKRFQPRAQGRAYRIRKRTSHITVIVSDGVQPASEAKVKAVTKKAKEIAAEEKAEESKPAAKKAPAKKTTSGSEATKKAGNEATEKTAKKAPAAKKAAKKTTEKAPAKKAAAKKAPAKKTAEPTEKEG